MKHARGVMAGMQASKPSVESADYEAIVSNESFDESSLGAESADLINENEELYSEAGELDNRADRMNTLVEYVETQVNPQEGGATQNEVALVEQAVDAALDGTGEDIEVVLPSLESAVGSTISLEALTDTIKNFLSASKELLGKAFSNFGKFLKGMVSRVQGMKNRIEKIEAKMKEKELSSEVEVSGKTAVHGFFSENDYLVDLTSSLKGCNEFCELLAKVSGPYAKTVITDHDTFLNDIVELFKRGTGRSSGKEEVRTELKGSFVKLANKLIKLNNETFHHGKIFGGLFVQKDPAEESEDFNVAAKNTNKSVPHFYLAGNIPDKTINVKGINSSSVKSVLDSVKRGIVAVSKVKVTNSMVNVELVANNPLGNIIVNGYSTAKVLSGITTMNRAYAESYVQPQMRLLDHYFRIANAQLTVIEKALK